MATTKKTVKKMVIKKAAVKAPGKTVKKIMKTR